MIRSSKYGLKFIDLYFNEQVHERQADLTRYHYWSQPVADSIVLPYLTVVVDISLEPAALLAGMGKTTRYDIRRADREDRFSFRAYIGESLPLAGFVKFFDDFADRKGTHRVDQRVLSILADHKLLGLTCICDAGESVLAWHAYMIAGTHTRLLYSGSAHVHVTDAGQRQFLARANRYLHWRDALLFRENGVLVLDLGGICETSCESPALRGIREFKTGFGGDIVRMFDCTKATSIRGRIALWLRNRHSTRIFSQHGLQRKS